MACYHPITAYRSLDINRSGKRSLVFSIARAIDDKQIKIPCNQCIGCRLERSRQWAIRCVHEASLHKENSFITLTYNNENLPKHGTLVLKHYQLFMKRLRKKYGNNIRYFHCGEYGELNKRPHYHACLFNHQFPDLKLWKIHKGQKYYISESLTKLWPYGWSTIGEVNFETAAYVARYITKKITGKKALEHYNLINKSTGELLKSIIPEYITMSRRPGIGKNWYNKYHRDVYPEDFVIIKNKKMRPPKFYDKQHQENFPEIMEEIKHLREMEALKHTSDNTRERLQVKEYLQNTKHKQLIRGYEKNET